MTERRGIDSQIGYFLQFDDWSKGVKITALFLGLIDAWLFWVRWRSGVSTAVLLQSVFIIGAPALVALYVARNIIQRKQHGVAALFAVNVILFPLGTVLCAGLVGAVRGVSRVVIERFSQGSSLSE
ncbi:MAG: hypothetical protein AB1540_10710 [Bdellovibrionota bacterium]